MTASRPKPKLADADVRSEFVTELDQSFAIEAGAGTGKTTLIVQRIVALVNDGVPIEKIVAITFTKKAALELKVRVRAALEKIAGSEDVSNEHRGFAVNALRRVDVAPIQTFHSFCDSLLRERPIEAGLDPGAETMEATGEAALRDEVFDETLAAAAEDESLRRATSEVLAAGIGSKELLEICRERVATRDLAPRCEGEASWSGASSAAPALEALVREIASEVAAILELARSGTKKPGDRLELAVETADRAISRLRGLDAAALARALFEGWSEATAKTGAKTNWRSAETKDEVSRRLLDVQQRVEAWRSAECVRRAAVVWEFASRFAARYEARKRQDGVLDFQDQLVKARDLLRDHLDVRREFGRRYHTLIVDEFQDTDPLQAEIAFFLAEREGGAARSWDAVEVGPGRLVIVGDPKQSIYRFRRADIEVYEAAKRRIAASGGRLCAISANFRSLAPILSFVNALFERLIVPDPNLANIQPEYVALVPPPDASPDASRDASPDVSVSDSKEPPDRRPAVVVLEEPGSAEFETRGPHPRTMEAPALTAFLASVVRGEGRSVRDPRNGEIRPARWSDIALLFRSAAGVETYEDALRAEGIPYRVAGGKRFHRRIEVKTALALLRSLDDASDEVAVLALLRGPLFAIPDRDLAEFAARGGKFAEPFSVADAASPALRAAFLRIDALRGKRFSRSISGYVEEVFAATRAYEIFLLKRDGEQAAANLEKLVALARALENATGFTFRRYVDEVDRVTQESERTPEAEFLDEDDDAVSLLTMHSSKGLEWPIVALVDLSAISKASLHRIVTREPTPRIDFAIGSKAAGYRAATPGFEAAIEAENRRELCERRRLLYVAATRARDLLILVRYHRKPPKSGVTGEKATGALVDELRADPFFAGAAAPFGDRVDASKLPRAEPVRSPNRVDLELEAPAGPAATRTLSERDAFATAARAVFERAGRGRAVTSATAEKARLVREQAGDASSVGDLAGLHDLGDSGDRGAGPREPQRIGGPAFGSFVHALFERIDFTRRAIPEPAILRALARESGQDSRAIAEAERLVTAFFGTPLCETLAGARRLLRESPFAFRDADRIVEGAIDLIAELPDGRLLIVDWKSDEVAGAALVERFESYRPQGEVYRRAVEAASGREVARVCFHFLRRGESRDL